MKGKPKSIKLKGVTNGMQVYWDGCPSKVKIWNVLEVKSSWVEVCPIFEKLNPVRAQSPRISELKTLVVEYEEKINHWTGSQPIVKKQLPLKYSQWQSVIDDGLLDKEVEFEIIIGHIDSSAPWIAKIIPQKKRMYSEEELKEIVFKFCEWRWVNMGEQRGLLYQPSLGNRWKAFKQTQS